MSCALWLVISRPLALDPKSSLSSGLRPFEWWFGNSAPALLCHLLGSHLFHPNEFTASVALVISYFVGKKTLKCAIESVQCTCPATVYHLLGDL